MNRHSGLAGQVALVTGAASGIGASVVDRLLARGCKVAGLDRMAQPARRHPDYLSIEADIANEDDCARAFARTREELGDLTLVAHSAGILRKSRLADLDVDEFDQVIRVNLRGTMLVLREAVRHMHSHEMQSSIVCVTSLAAHRTGIGLSAYSAAKRGVMALVAAGAVENAPLIRINAVAPGLIDTPMQQGRGNAVGASAGDRAERSPLARLGSADEVAAAVEWLLSSEASFVTGSALTVDGGALIAVN